MGQMTGGQVVWGRGLGQWEGNAPAASKPLTWAARQVSRQIWGLTVSDPALMYVDTTIARFLGSLGRCSW